MEITSLLSCIFSHFLNKILSYVLLSWLKGFWEVHWILMKMEFWIAKKILKNKSLQCYSALCCTLTLKISYKNTVVLKHRIESIVCTVWVSDKFSNTVTRKDSLLSTSKAEFLTERKKIRPVRGLFWEPIFLSPVLLLLGYWNSE